MTIGGGRQHTLALHGTNPAVLRDMDECDQGWGRVTYGKEDPLEHDAFVVASGGEGEETFGVVLANKVKKDGGALKDAERLWFVLAVDEGGDATVGVVSDEPRFLLTVGREIDPLDAVGARSGAAWCRRATLTRNL